MKLTKKIAKGRASAKRKKREFFELAGRFRRTNDPEEIKRLGDQLGRIVFGAPTQD
jgi:hypothetical protein